MPAERAMSSVRIAIKPDVLRQEVPEGLEQRSIPVWSRQERSEHGLKPAILVTRERQCPDVRIHRAGRGQVALTDCGEFALPAFRNLRQLKRSPHEFVVVHLLPGSRNTWPRRKVGGIPFAAIKFEQSLVVRIK